MKNDYDPRMGFLTTFMSGILGLIFGFVVIVLAITFWQVTLFIILLSLLVWRIARGDI
jgi:uncharacterized membrane protein